MMSVNKFETVVRVVTACSLGDGPPSVSASIDGQGWTIRISNQSVVYKGATLDEACDSLMRSWDAMARARQCELDRMAKWLRDASGKVGR